MPRNPEEAPTAFSRAVAEGIADAIEEAGMSQAAVARKAGLSANYFNERMRFVKSFTLSDIDKIAAAMRFNPTRFLLDINATLANVSAPAHTAATDPFPVLTADELSQRELDKAALAGQDETAQPAVDEVPDQEDSDDDDARPGA